MTKFKFQFFLIILVLVITGCGTTTHTKVDRRSQISYNPSVNTLNPNYLIYNTSDEISTLIIKTFPKEFLFSMANPDLKYMAEFSVTYFLFDRDSLMNKNSFADSGYFEFQIPKEKENDAYYVNIPVKAIRGKSYNLKVTIKDLIRVTKVEKHLLVNKTNAHSSQDFLIYPTDSRYPDFPPYHIGNTTFKIRSSTPIDTLFFNYYASPLDSLSKMTFRGFKGVAPTAVWKYPYSESTPFFFNLPGLFFIQTDTNSSEGFTLLNFNATYPLVRNVEDMIDPLEYIASAKELSTVRNEKNTKLAIDNFWLQKSDNTERGRELIRIYYNRVFLANYYFTSFEPGWKTDRGRVYIILGPPDAIATDGGEERWLYNRENSEFPGIYVFKRQEHPLTSDYYILIDEQSNMTGYQKSLNQWRSGNIFSIDR